MIKLDKKVKEQLLEISSKNQIYLEGNILKLIDGDSDEDFKKYLKTAIENDKSSRKKRLEVTKQIQTQNKQLIDAQLENEKLMSELKEALEKTEMAKEEAEQDLDMLQKKIQTELIGTIVKVALWIIIGVGVITSLMYFVSILMGVNTNIVGNAWSNFFGILLTNSFSIIGTIMGVKYASEKQKN